MVTKKDTRLWYGLCGHTTYYVEINEHRQGFGHDLQKEEELPT